MKEVDSAFYNHSAQLSFWDFLKLLFGGVVGKKFSALKIGLWRMPDNSCPCESCRKILGEKGAK